MSSARRIGVIRVIGVRGKPNNTRYRAPRVPIKTSFKASRNECFSNPVAIFLSNIR